MAIFGFKIDLWTVWGLISQGVFFISFVVQWYKSEKKGESYLPLEFWSLRIIGSLMLLIYVFIRRDLVVLLSLVLQIIMYSRNIRLIILKEKNLSEHLHHLTRLQ